MTSAPAGRLLRAALAPLLVATVAGIVACSAPTDRAQPGSDGPPPSGAVRVAFDPGLSEDLYLPAGRGRVPLVVLVPGGSWLTADPTGLTGLAASLAAAGVAAAPTRIRAADDGVVYPVPVEDVLCAVAAAAEQTRAQGLTPDPVAVLGHSSGAHLAALAVLAVDDYAPSCASPVVTPDALVGLSGPYDIRLMSDYATALFGAGPDDDPDAWAAANPVLRADLRPDVPVLLRHGDADQNVSVDFTTQFGDALEAAGHPTTVQVVPGADHETIYSAEVSADPIAEWLLALPTSR